MNTEQKTMQKFTDKDLFREALRAKLVEKGYLEVKDQARFLGIKEGTLRNYLIGRRVVASIENLVAIERKLGITFKGQILRFNPKVKTESKTSNPEEEPLEKDFKKPERVRKHIHYPKYPKYPKYPSFVDFRLNQSSLSDNITKFYRIEKRRLMMDVLVIVCMIILSVLLIIK